MDSYQIKIGAIEKIVHEKGEFAMHPSSKPRMPGRYYGGVSIQKSSSTHIAELTGELLQRNESLDQNIILSIDAKELHPNWSKITSKRENEFNSEIKRLVGKVIAVEVKITGDTYSIKPNYEAIRTNLN
jgi:hypothetical protein